MSTVSTDTALQDERESDPYRTPSSRVADMEMPATDGALLYVLSPTKFWVMMLGTMRLFWLYWFYRNWAGLNRVRGCYWPVPRALFHIFFVHSLFRHIDVRLAEAGRSHRWDGALYATLFILVMVASFGVDFLSAMDIGTPWVDLASLALLGMAVLPLWPAQRAINAAEGDPEGRSNATFTAANVAWLVLGAALWVTLLLATAVIVYPSGAALL